MIRENYYNPGMENLREAVRLADKYHNIPKVPAEVQARYSLMLEMADSRNCDTRNLPTILGLGKVTGYFESLITPEDFKVDPYEEIEKRMCA